MSICDARVRVGTITYSSGKKVIPSVEGFKQVVCLTKSTKYGALGPYELKTEDGKIMENVWQFSKVYKRLDAVKKVYSRWQPTVVWEHGAVNMLTEGVPNDDYWSWREKGMNAPLPVRWPAGKRHGECLYALEHAREHYKDGIPEEEKLGYIEARKRLYMPLYIGCLTSHPKYHELKSEYDRGEKLLILEVDGPIHSSLPYYKKKYGVSDSFIELGEGGATMLATEENLRIMLNDEKHPFGHGYCMATALQGFSLE